MSEKRRVYRKGYRIRRRADEKTAGIGYRIRLSSKKKLEKIAKKNRVSAAEVIEGLVSVVGDDLITITRRSLEKPLQIPSSRRRDCAINCTGDVCD